jgi:hypothetical protein
MRQWSSSTRWTLVPGCPTPPVFLLLSHPRSSRTSICLQSWRSGCRRPGGH